MFRKIKNAHLGLILASLLAGCEFKYDPSKKDDAPSSPGTKSPQIFHYRKNVEAPYTTDDLTEDMPLSKLLDIALYNNPQTRSSWYAARAAAYGYHVSLSTNYPTLAYQGNLQDQTSNGAASISGVGGAVFPTGSSASATTTTSGTSSSSSTPSVFISSAFNELTLSYLVLDFGGRYGLQDLAFQTLVQANWQHNLTMQQVMLSVINAYTSYIGNIALVSASEQNLKDAQVLLDAAILMKKYGLATMTDILTAQSTVEQMKLNLEQARGAEKTSLAQLLIALGLPPETEICVLDLPSKLPVIEIACDVNSLIELAKEKRPDIGTAIALVNQQEAELQISRSSGMPVLTFNGSTSRVDFITPKKPYIYNNSIALNLNFPIFAGFYYINQQKQIRAQIAEAIANVDATVAVVVTEVVTNYYAFTTAEASLPSTEALLEYSRRAYRGMVSQYKVGTASMQDVVTSLTTLSNARAQQVITRTQWAAALANLAFSVGILNDNSGTWKNAPPQSLYRLNYKDEG